MEGLGLWCQRCYASRQIWERFKPTSTMGPACLGARVNLFLIGFANQISTEGESGSSGGSSPYPGCGECIGLHTTIWSYEIEGRTGAGPLWD